MLEADWEIASHGYRWIDYKYFGKTEREHCRRSPFTPKLQAVVPGWYTGRTSPNTRRLVVEEGGFLYDADSYADDLPYWVHDYGLPHLVIPYTLDNNDMRFATNRGLILAINSLPTAMPLMFSMPKAKPHQDDECGATLPPSG